jgi:hypothetical protein
MFFKRGLFLVAFVFLLVFVLDLLLAESLDTDLIEIGNQGYKVEYWVPYTGGGTSKCYPLTFSRLKNGQKVILKRSLFVDVCIVMTRNREAIDKKIYEYWIDRHPVVD